jgi:hypothetical protein
MNKIKILKLMLVIFLIQVNKDNGGLNNDYLIKFIFK